MAAAWRNFQANMKDKRTGKKKRSSNTILEKEEVVVQRLSSEVSGKAQKYSRVGPREFVPYDYEDLTLGNIKRACARHFSSRITDQMVCDVLAGEQGPSCTSLDQIPDLKVVHIRFVEPSPNDAATGDDDFVPPPKRPRKFPAVPTSMPARKEESERGEAASLAIPRSLSVLDMLKLGKEIHDTQSAASVDLFQFDMKHMAWTLKPLKVEFTMEKEPFGKGGFREAFKASSKTPGFVGQKWVIKKYLGTTLHAIKATNQTVEQHTKKVVQMHMLAKNFADKLEVSLRKEECLSLYGTPLKYKQIFMGVMEVDIYVTVEEFIKGEFSKYINNDGKICGAESEVRQKALPTSRMKILRKS